MARGRWASAALVVLAVLQAACLIEIREVRDPESAFRAARAQAERERLRPGRAHHLNVLVFDPDESKLVRVSMPIWLASKLEGQVRKGEGDGALERSVGPNLARKIRLKDLAAAGRGLIADVEDDDGQVLVWLR